MHELKGFRVQAAVLLAGRRLAETTAFGPLEGGGVIQEQNANIHSEQHDKERPTWYADQEG
ncbi:hypothetical protein [Cupriavidus oxalaticus]|uniref:Transposase n=1 Tax=Cupriavidus oxalaticus TaxID=96344 RepID=A0ABX7HRE3_9BURK|nr:hypothetical protein [Cupriavidus oxalaticus]QRQ88963.1 hypothetical protein JTE91_20775 [Cupriavidus oxalaticus]QRQ92711.1 hypothetical protein JTE92_21485 [Cupriavidus oxalaticus]WQD81314.1 hypothetical protein U0036_09215 [Cupriavidus oxalaticus]